MRGGFLEYLENVATLGDWYLVALAGLVAFLFRRHIISFAI